MKVSVLTPTLDRPDFVSKAIESVLAQTYEDWELVLYDVGTEKVRVPDDPRVRVFVGEAAGPARDFQFCLDHAEGVLVTPLADDDLLPPHALETAVAHIGDAEWLCGMTVIVRDGMPTAVRGGTLQSVNITRKGMFWLGGAIYWRPSLTDRVGGFDAKFDGAADYDLYLRFLGESDPVLVRDVLYLYADHDGTDSRVRAANQAEKAAVIARGG